MTVTFRPARRANVPLVLGLAGPSGGGKTYSALRLARGLAGDAPFFVVDTENGRSQMYADTGAPWQHGDFQPPFTPERYIEHLTAAEEHNPPVVVLDSMSHEYESEGGLFDIQEEYLQQRAGDDARKREALSFSSWNVAKQRHKRLVGHILRMQCHLVVAMRAADKIEIVKENGKTKAIPKRTMTGLNGWEPICERRFPYELTASFLLLPDRPGVPHPIKLPDGLRQLVPLDKPITEKTGEALAKWAAGTPAEAGDTPPHGLPQYLLDELIAAKKKASPPDEWIHERLEALGASPRGGKVSLATIRSLTEEQASGLLDALKDAIAAREEEVTF